MPEKRMEWLWRATLLALLVLVWWAPAIPSQDGPSHLYNLLAFKGLWQGDPHWTRHHVLIPELATNLGFLVFAWPLSQVLPLWAVERTIISLHLILICAFAVTWLRVTGRPAFPTAWIALAFAFPWPLFMGFYGFQLACDFALLGMCAAWQLRTRPVWMVGPMHWLMGFSLILLHAGGAALFTALIALIEATRRDHSPLRRLGHAGYFCTPILIALFWAIGLQATAISGESGFSWQTPEYIAFLLVTFASVTFSQQGLTFLLVAAGFFCLCKWPTGSQRRPRDHATRFVIAASVFLVLLHVCLPDMGFGGGMMTGRFIGWLPLLLLPILNASIGSYGPLPRRWIPGMVSAASLTSLVLAVLPVSMRMAEIREAAALHASDGIVASVFFDRAPSVTALIEPLLHVDSYFAMPRGILATNYEARSRFFPIQRNRRGTREFAEIDRAAERNIDWNELGIDALVTIDPSADDRRQIARAFASIWRGSDGRIEMWRRRPLSD